MGKKKDARGGLQPHGPTPPSSKRRPPGEQADLARLLQDALLNKYELAKISGLAPSYLSYVEKGDITKAGRDKLLRAAVAALMSFADTNRLLRHYEQQPLMAADVPLLIEASARRKIIGLQPVLHGVNYDLISLALEQPEGDLTVVHDMPFAALRTPEYAVLGDWIKYDWAKEYSEVQGLDHFEPKVQDFFARQLEEKNYLEVRLGLRRERLRVVREHLKKGVSINVVVCRGCFSDHVKDRAEKPVGRKHFVAHIAAHLLYMRRFPRFTFRLVEDCPQLRFEIKHDPRKENEGWMFFSGKVRHFQTERTETKLLGFATDSKRAYKFLKAEYDRLDALITQQAADMPPMRDQILDICASHHIEREEILLAEKALEASPLFS